MTSKPAPASPAPLASGSLTGASTQGNGPVPLVADAPKTAVRIGKQAAARVSGSAKKRRAELCGDVRDKVAC